MDGQIDRKFLQELRARMNDITAAIQPLTALLEKHGSEADRRYASVVYKSLYRLVRDIRHAEVCGEEDPLCQFRMLDIAGLCRDVGRQVEFFAKMLGVDFEWSLDSSGLISLGDDQLLEMALLELLANAFEAAGEGGRVILAMTTNGKNWTITVEDSGGGLPWLQEDDPLRPGGAGLGLDMVRRVAQLHGGMFLTSNAAGQGLRAVLTAPVKKPQSPKEAEMLEAAIPIDRWGGFSPVLAGLSPVLPAKAFEDLDD